MVEVTGVRPSGSVTFLFTDIEASSRLWDEHPEEMSAALARHDDIIRTAVSARGGVVFTTGGDGVGVVFQRSIDAVIAAVDAQRTLLAERWPEGIDLRVRMGVNSGTSVERNGDYLGPPVNKAARLMAAAHGGQIVVSEVTRALLPDTAPVELVDLGSHRLRGLTHPTHAFGVRADGLEWLDRPLTTAPAPGNLPKPATQWFGSAADLQHRASALAGQRLVTLTGAGGVGKSRLAIEMGSLVDDEFGDGVWLIELAPVADPDAVVAVVAGTLSIGRQEGMTLLDSVADWLRHRNLLLIVDNCEHLISSVVEVVSAIVAGCPSVTVLATSREPLGVDGERVYRMPSLTRQDAVALFCDRAAAADEAMVASDTDIATVAEICDRLDGIPLAIELAASRARSLSLADLAERLDDRFRLLRRGSRGGVERHQTLRATVAWSYNLLTDDERILFERVSVFAGGFGLASADEVCGDDTGDGDAIDSDTTETLSSLVDKSMLIADRDERGTRYRMLETLRQYAEERLDDHGEGTRLRARHLRHCVDIAQHANRLLQSSREFEGEGIFTREWDNLRSAHGWALATGQVDLAESVLWWSTLYAGLYGHGELGDWATRTVAVTDPDRLKASTFGVASYWAYVAGDNEAAVALARRGVERADGLTHPDTTWCWYVLTAVSDGTDDPRGYDEMARRFEAAALASGQQLVVVLACARRAYGAALNDAASLPAVLARLETAAAAAGSRCAQVVVASTRGRVALLTGEPALAQHEFERARALSAQHGIDVFEGMSILGLAVAHSLVNDGRGDGAFADAVGFIVSERNWGHLSRALTSAANHFARHGRHQHAAVLFGYLQREMNPAAFPGDRAAGRSFVKHEPAADEWMSQGAAMSTEDIVRYTLHALGEPDGL
jgi:predicted ATPase/class 3 adenylate cyclase